MRQDMSGLQVFFRGLSGIPHPRPLTAEEERTASDAPLTVLFDALLSDRGLPGGMVDIMRERLEQADAKAEKATRYEALRTFCTPPRRGVVAWQESRDDFDARADTIAAAQQKEAPDAR